MSTTTFTNKTQLLEAAEEKLNALCAEYNSALEADKPMADINAIEDQIKTIEAEYAATMRTKVFDDLGKAENPIKAAVMSPIYTVLKHRVQTAEKVVVGMTIEEQEQWIDLYRMCQYLKLPSAWYRKVERLNQLMCLRTAHELGLKEKDIKTICDSFYMSELARKEDLGETPTSNTQMVKALQRVFDDILFEDNGKGGNLYRVNNHDVAFILKTYTSRGKAALSVRVSKSANLLKNLVAMMHRVVLDKEYALEFRVSNRLAEAAPVKEVKAEKPAKKSAKKAEKVSEKTVDSSEKAA